MSKETTRTYVRKLRFTDRKFQLNFLMYLTLIGVLTDGIVYLGNATFFAGFKNSIGTARLPVDYSVITFASEQQRAMHLIFVITSLMVLSLVVFFGIILSHRIAGPLFHLKSQLEEMAKTGTWKELKFRKNDYFHELAESMNRAMAKVLESRNQNRD